MGQASLYDLVCHDLGTSAGLSQLRPQTINEPRVVRPLLAQCKCWITTTANAQSEWWEMAF